MTAPTSTYRLHLTAEFTLHDALGLVDHIDRLGIDWMYLSPIQTVPADATHGYHILDPDTVNPQLGGYDALVALHQALAERGRGLLLDIVPNHMASSVDNARWADLLRHGPGSANRHFFDVDLGDQAHPQPVVLPVLDRSLAQAIDEGHVRVATPAEGIAVLAVGDHLHLPLSPDTDPAAPITDVLASQHYTLHHWQEGQRIINWRRFFAVNELVGVKVERAQVFDDTHRLILRLVDDGILDGLRIDHIDGLADPAAYLQRLRSAAGPDCWLVVEKILESDEALPAEWPIAGTTGYEVATLIASWLTDVEGYGHLTDAFTSRTGIRGPVASELAESKRHVVNHMFPAEIETVRRLLGDIEGTDADLVAEVLRDLAAHLHGYRTYAPLDGPIPEASLARLNDAADAAAVTRGTQVVHRVHGGLIASSGRAALIRLQQLTGAVAAKGFEDRLLFRHVALSSLCEVGVDAATLDSPPSPDVIAERLAARQQDWPDAGTTTSTHDTKRAEDVRARIAVLAEMPQHFIDLLDTLDREIGVDIGTHAPWLLTQTALGMLDLEGDDVTDIGARLADYAAKALREAELDTSHDAPDAAFERRVAEWVNALTSSGAAADALRSMADRIAIAGATNALSALVLKLVGPGVADIYRGTEIWDASLVDPDNRRPLRVDVLADRLRSVTADAITPAQGHATPDALREGWRDGRVKMLVTREGLHLRRRHPSVFADGELTVPRATGVAAGHAAVIRRHLDGHPTIIGIATRLPHRLAGGEWPIGERWGDTSVVVGPGISEVVDVITGQTHAAHGGVLRLDGVLSALPTAMLVANG